MANKTTPLSSENCSVRTRKRKNPTSPSWFERINDDKDRLVIPVGPRFQVDLPEWKGPLNNEVGDDTSLKWLGTNVWPTKDSERMKKEGKVVGQGRPDFCFSPSPGTIECVKRHVLTKRVKLMMDLGSAFWRWKFDDMGEEVTKLWNTEEEMEFEDIAKANLNFLGKSFLKRTLECLPLQNKKSVVNYYFNIPRRMSVLTRSGSVLVDTDDETLDEEKPSPKASRKKCRHDRHTSSSVCKYSKTGYMNGRR